MGVHKTRRKTEALQELQCLESLIKLEAVVKVYSSFCQKGKKEGRKGGKDKEKRREISGRPNAIQEGNNPNTRQSKL